MDMTLKTANVVIISVAGLIGLGLGAGFVYAGNAQSNDSRNECVIALAEVLPPSLSAQEINSLLQEACS